MALHLVQITGRPLQLLLSMPDHAWADADTVTHHSKLNTADCCRLRGSCSAYQTAPDQATAVEPLLYAIAHSLLAHAALVLQVGVRVGQHPWP
jgi:hypothetical protein